MYSLPLPRSIPVLVADDAVRRDFDDGRFKTIHTYNCVVRERVFHSRFKWRVPDYRRLRPTYRPNANFARDEHRRRTNRTIKNAKTIRVAQFCFFRKLSELVCVLYASDTVEKFN